MAATLGTAVVATGTLDEVKFEEKCRTNGISPETIYMSLENPLQEDDSRCRLRSCEGS